MELAARLPMLFLLLLQLLLMQQGVVSKQRACIGTLRSDQTMNSSIRKLEIMRNRLAGCQYIIGSLHIMKFRHQEFTERNMKMDLSFLSEIREITGCLHIIDNCLSEPILLTNLTIIRGRHCQDNGNASVIVHQSHDDSCATPTGVRQLVNMRQLRRIDQGNVLITGNGQCYMQVRINYLQLFSNYKKQRLIVRASDSCNSQSAKIIPQCHIECPKWPEDGKRHCWGPAKDQCQSRSSCISYSQADCPNNKCYTDSMGNERCCSEQCLGGCYGPSTSHCFGCKAANRNGTCVPSCAPQSVYDVSTAHMLPTKQSYYPLGPLCVAVCPPEFFVQHKACVSRCMPGYTADWSRRKCVPLDASVNRVCQATTLSVLLCDPNNQLISADYHNDSQLCTEFDGDLSIHSDCFSKNSNNNRILTLHDLYYYLGRLRKVTGSVHITDLTGALFRNITFLSQLEIIETKSGSGDDTQDGSLVIHSNALQHLGTNKMRFIRGYLYISAGGQFNKRLFPTESAFNDGLIKASVQKIIIRTKTNSSSTKATQLPHCHPACNANYGCWGPLPSDCVLCQHYRLGNGSGDCVLNCTHSWYPSGGATHFNMTNGTMLSEKQCFKCHSLCDQCWSGTAHHCSSCRNGAYLHNNTCKLACNEVTHFANSTSRTCHPCSPVCVTIGNRLATCSGPDATVGSNGCTMCTRVMATDGKLVCLKPSHARCPNGYYAALLDLAETDVPSSFVQLAQRLGLPVSVCKRCAAQCKTCHLAADRCTSCTHYSVQVGTSSAAADNEIKQCQRSADPVCPSGYYANTSDSTCYRCALSMCADCTGDYDIESDGDTGEQCYACNGNAYTIVLNSNSTGNYSGNNNSSGRIPVNCLTECPKQNSRSVKLVLNDVVARVCTFNSVIVDDDSGKRVRAMLTNSSLSPLILFGLMCAIILIIAIASSTCVAMLTSNKLRRQKLGNGKKRQVGEAGSFVNGDELQVLCPDQFQKHQQTEEELEASDEGDDTINEQRDELLASPGVLRTISENELQRGAEVGSGAFGTVYHGHWLRHEGSSVQVAIKILADSGGLGPDCLGTVSDELLEESRIMASVRHQHCAQLVGICMTQPPQLITQFMPMGNLRDYLRSRRSGHRIGSGHLLLYSAQIANGMAYLESRGIIHRDLACRNVLVSSATSVQITDFGLAKVLDDETGCVYRASGGKLPVKWLALECLLNRRFTHKSDVWAYGVTLWEIFTFGESPYPNVHPVDLADYLEKGERLPQPPICTLDVYMVMIKCWMLNEQLRPGFEEMEASFRKMTSDPARYVYIKGDRYARSVSTASSYATTPTPTVTAAGFGNANGISCCSMPGMISMRTEQQQQQQQKEKDSSPTTDSYMNIINCEDYLQPISISPTNSTATTSNTATTIASANNNNSFRSNSVGTRREEGEGSGSNFSQQLPVSNPEYFFNATSCQLGGAEADVPV